MSVPDLLVRVPNALGAYVLAIDLTRPLGLRLPRRREFTLPAGRYVYCGSAYGPGGLRARIGRHLRTHKPVRWHIDQLSRAGRITAVKAAPGGRECALLAGLLAIPGSSVPVPGFGSTDCRRCPAHLAAVPEDLDLCVTALCAPLQEADTITACRRRTPLQEHVQGEPGLPAPAYPSPRDC